MIKIENVSTVGWEPSIRGARNPMNSWEKSDSLFYNIRSNRAVESLDGEIIFYEDEYGIWTYCGSDKRKPLYSWTMDDKTGQLFHENINKLMSSNVPVIGPNDLKLLSGLGNAGSDEAKFRRMIVVYVDVTAPLYWWKECDTYKVGTVRNSCSTMHKIHAKEFTLEDFSTEHLLKDEDGKMPGIEKIYGVPVHIFDGANGVYAAPFEFYNHVIDFLNHIRNVYLMTRDKSVWWQMIQLLPSSYNQQATLMLNYEVLANMYHARKNHKLDEWREFCKWIESLPYAKELIIGEEKTGDTVEQLAARINQYKDRIDYLKERLAKELYSNVVSIEDAIKIIEGAGENKLRDILTGKGVHDRMKKIFPEQFKEESDGDNDNV